MKCIECVNIEYIDINKKKKIKNCKVGLTTHNGLFHYCKGYNKMII